MMDPREQVRTFHLTGKGLEQYAAVGVLRPLELEGFPQLESAYPYRLRDGTAVPFAARAVTMMHGAALGRVRKLAREPMRQRVRQALQKMKDLLAVDDSHAAASPETVAASLGVEAGFFDAGALALAVKSSAKGAQTLEPQRRARIEKAAAALERFLLETNQAPLYWLFHSGEEPEGIGDTGGRCLRVLEAVPSAIRFCRKALEEFSEVQRALRVARLEAESAYVPEVHDQRIERVDWRAAEDGELAALPGVAALAQSSEEFTQVARSGLPVHVLLPTAGFESADDGCVAMAHREAFVLQGSLAEPERLMAGFEQMADNAGPAVAVVSVPGAGENDAEAWLGCTMLVRSRSFAGFAYNPALGETLAERFELQPAAGADGFSAAHAAALMAAQTRHFRVLPETEWNDEQLELKEYLAAYKAQPPAAVPYLWVSDGRGGKRRAVMTRELAELCRERRRAWRFLEEMAGIGNSFVSRAVEQTRAELEKQFTTREQAALEKGRQEGVQNAVSKLVTALMNPKAAVPARVAAPVAAATPAPAAKPAPAAAKPAQAAAVAEAPADPYIDTFLCTSCNDCMKVNARLFLYNSDKQAYLGDLSTGTFADLVKAAEGCPAKCIHPGKPRPGDATATPAMVARAAKLG